MNNQTRNHLHLIRQRIQSLLVMREHDEAFQGGLNLAISAIEWTIDAVGGDHIGGTTPKDAIDGIEGALAELQLRLETHGEAWIDDPVHSARLAMAAHLLEQACLLLSRD
ncbi:MAG: hypothetical protein KF800_13850 [Lysobacter sp.]|nr:hypothetical protein [Lysobacter sp.]